MASVDFLIARLPVFDRWLKVRAYELRVNSRSLGAMDWLARLRTGEDQEAEAAGVEFFETLTGHKLAILRLAAKDVEKVDLELLPGGWLVWPQIKDNPPRDEFFTALKQIRAFHQGVVLDAAFCDKYPKAFRCADIIALDMKQDPSWLDSMAKEKLKKPLLAVGVDAEEYFLNALRLGCELFQGRFYIQPKLEAGKNMPAFRLNMMRLLVAVHSPELDFSFLEKLINQDVSLAYKLLRYINSPYFGVRQEVKSINQAFVLLGEKSLRNWVSLIALSGAVTDKPDELVILSLVRALFFSEFAELAGMGYLKDEAFLTGLFSLLDVFFDQSMPKILEELPLSEEIVEALLYQEGPLGKISTLALAYEKGHWQKVREVLEQIECPSLELLPAYVSSVDKAHSLFQLGQKV